MMSAGGVFCVAMLVAGGWGALVFYRAFCLLTKRHFVLWRRVILPFREGVFCIFVFKAVRVLHSVFLLASAMVISRAPLPPQLPLVGVCSYEDLVSRFSGFSKTDVERAPALDVGPRAAFILRDLTESGLTRFLDMLGIAFNSQVTMPYRGVSETVGDANVIMGYVNGGHCTNRRMRIGEKRKRGTPEYDDHAVERPRVTSSSSAVEVVVPEMVAVGGVSGVCRRRLAFPRVIVRVPFSMFDS